MKRIHSVDVIKENAKTIVKSICDKHEIDSGYVPEKQIEESMTCPICKNGVMSYSISSDNGHRSAICSEQCFGFYVE